MVLSSKVSLGIKYLKAKKDQMHYTPIHTHTFALQISLLESASLDYLASYIFLKPLF